MTDKTKLPVTEERDAVEKVTGFWNQYSKQILIAIAAIVIIGGGIYGYNTFIAAPNEKKASEAMRYAEDFFRKDSLALALNGDNLNPGFIKIISKYSGTKAANLAHFYAGTCYLQMGDFKNAVKYLEDYSTKEPLVKARAKALLADANSELGKKEEAVKLYKEAGTTFEKDDYYSPQYLVRAAFLYEQMGKTKDAVEVYKLIKEKYPQFKEVDIDKYLGKLGEIE
ncbi:MAG TPA: tetratricopeptide repeat protein [Chitinophagaceae bacterium]|nr:tetratricopeptide repeat protein [Chitinophagaceae bacterium]